MSKQCKLYILTLKGLHFIELQLCQYRFAPIGGCVILNSNNIFLNLTVTFLPYNVNKDLVLPLNGERYYRLYRLQKEAN